MLFVDNFSYYDGATIYTRCGDAYSTPRVLTCLADGGGTLLLQGAGSSATDKLTPRRCHQNTTLPDAQGNGEDAAACDRASEIDQILSLPLRIRRAGEPVRHAAARCGANRSGPDPIWCDNCNVHHRQRCVDRSHASVTATGGSASAVEAAASTAALNASSSAAAT